MKENDSVTFRRTLYFTSKDVYEIELETDEFGEPFPPIAFVFGELINEFISHKLQQWCDNRNIKLLFIQPGRPTQNAFIERKNGSIRKELLDAYLFESLVEVRELTRQWRWDYNHLRPHKALGYCPPAIYVEQRRRVENNELKLYP